MFCVPKGACVWILLNDYQFTSDKWKTVGCKQVYCRKIERLDFQYKASPVRGMTSCPQSATRLNQAGKERENIYIEQDI